MLRHPCLSFPRFFVANHPLPSPGHWTEIGLYHRTGRRKASQKTETTEVDNRLHNIKCRDGKKIFEYSLGEVFVISDIYSPRHPPVLDSVQPSSIFPVSESHPRPTLRSLLLSSLHISATPVQVSEPWGDTHRGHPLPLPSHKDLLPGTSGQEDPCHHVEKTFQSRLYFWSYSYGVQTIKTVVPFIIQSIPMHSWIKSL